MLKHSLQVAVTDKYGQTGAKLQFQYCGNPNSIKQLGFVLVILRIDNLCPSKASEVSEQTFQLVWKQFFMFDCNRVHIYYKSLSEVPGRSTEFGV